MQNGKASTVTAKAAELSAAGAVYIYMYLCVQMYLCVCARIRACVRACTCRGVDARTRAQHPALTVDPSAWVG